MVASCLFRRTWIVALIAALPVSAAESVPFKGFWAGQTVSAVPTDDPNVVFVTSAGEGQLTHLGHYSMVSPHFSNLVTLEVDGTMEFTAANGDQLFADVAGQLAPLSGGFLFGTLPATITGGTGRFANATGSFGFTILFDTATFESFAVLDGTITWQAAAIKDLLFVKAG